MLEKLCSWILYKRLGWHKVITQPHPDKYIISLAPHTSNWDFIIGQLYMRAEGMKTNFLMKKEWFFWPLGSFFRHIGGIPVYRSKHTSLTDILAQSAREAETFHLCITPEGTRKKTTEWKHGFYYIALKANLPILLYGLDYGSKCIYCTKTITPTGDVDREMKEIKSYYKDFRGRKPENFSIGDEA